MAEADTTPLECPACGATETAVFLQSRNGYPIVRCSGCRLAFTDARNAPPPASLYPAFDQSSAFLPRLLRRWLGIFVQQREAIVRSVKPCGRLLDFGCGSGAFARWMADGGYDVVGLEPFSLGQPLQAERVLLLREPLESAVAKVGRFDVITMWHVLEHLPRPIDVLRTLSRLLAPGGVFIVSVPNLLSWQSGLFGARWFHLDPPRHVIHFDAGTLEQTLAAAGMVRFRSWDFLPEYGSSGWVQSTLNSVLPHSNYLYEVVKDRGAIKDLGFGAHALHMTASILGGAPAFLLSLPIEALASAVHRGAALTFAARKIGET
jgi:SAM-dependent methyltransferase